MNRSMIDGEVARDATDKRPDRPTDSEARCRACEFPPDGHFDLPRINHKNYVTIYQ